MRTPLERYAELRQYVLRRVDRLKHPGDFHFGVGAKAFLAVWDYATAEHKRAEHARDDAEYWQGVTIGQHMVAQQWADERDEARQIAGQLLRYARALLQGDWISENRRETAAAYDAMSPALRKLVEG